MASQPKLFEKWVCLKQSPLWISKKMRHYFKPMKCLDPKSQRNQRLFKNLLHSNTKKKFFDIGKKWPHFFIGCFKDKDNLLFK